MPEPTRPDAGPAAGGLTDDVVRQATEAPARALFSRRHDGRWHDVTAAEFRREVQSVAKGLLAAGVQPGDRVALVAKTRYEWTLLDYAIWWVGAVTTPIYETASADQIGWILSDSGASACAVETPEHAARIEQADKLAPTLKHVWTMGSGGLDDIMSAGHIITDEELERRRANVSAADVATLIYTSGTTGPPKGCRLTHDNFHIELAGAIRQLGALFERQGASTLLFLPLAHVFARIVQVGCVKAGVRLGHCPEVKNLARDLGEFRPTFLLAVPRVLEKMFNVASQQAHSEGRGRTFDLAVRTAIDHSRSLDRRRPWLRARHVVFDRLVYADLRNAFGGRAEYVVSGGAPLGERLAHLFRGIGIPVLEGYGLTESTGALTANTPGAVRVGTVGRPLPGTSVRVADDGELLFKGGQVFTGYWHDDQTTSQVLDPQGWLHTGDLGEVDEDGYVRYSGRKKELLVTAGGKNVAPAVLEEAVRQHPLVSQCLVVGEARPFVAAIIALDREAVRTWRRQQGKKGEVRALLDDPALIGNIQRAVDAANVNVSSAESIRRFRLVAEEWTEQSGHLTPTLKLRRGLVMQEYGEVIERLYR